MSTIPKASSHLMKSVFNLLFMDTMIAKRSLSDKVLLFCSSFFFDFFPDRDKTVYLSKHIVVTSTVKANA